MRPLDSYGNPPSDEAWEGHRKRLIELNIKYGPIIRKEKEEAKQRLKMIREKPKLTTTHTRTLGRTH